MNHNHVKLAVDMDIDMFTTALGFPITCIIYYWNPQNKITNVDIANKREST